MTPDGALLLAALTDLGVKIEQHADVVMAYMATRIEKLKTIAGEMGYDEALKAEGVNLALFAVGEEIKAADQLDAMTLRVFETILAVAVRTVLV